jgi:hypothetical protein
MSSMCWKGLGDKQGYRQRRSTRPEFVSRDLALWAYQRAYIAAFNGRFRAECLNAHWFLNLQTPEKRWRIGASTTTRTTAWRDRAKAADNAIE